jgi:hypothetical protein
MPRTLSVSLPHDLTEAEVRRRLVAGIADARMKYPAYLQSARESWTGNTMEFVVSAIGQTITGRVQIEPKVVHVHVDLPLLLAMLADRLKPQIESQVRKLLQKK